jgi:hypothetical protein
LAPLALPALLACAHPAWGASDEERLGAAVNGDSNSEPKATIQSCEDQQEALGKARNAERSESERLRSYMEVVRTLGDRVDQNQKTVAHDPDIAYAGGASSQAAADSRALLDGCREMYGDARREFDELVHDLFSPLLVLDVQNGKHSRSARVSLPLLRSALEELAPPRRRCLARQAERRRQGAPRPEKGRQLSAPEALCRSPGSPCASPSPPFSP